MSKKLLSIATLAMVLALVAPVSAEEAKDNLNVRVSLPSAPAIILSSSASEPIPASIEKLNKLPLVQARGHKYITQRLYSLDVLKKRVNASKLTAEQKTKLAAMIDENVTGLKALDEQIKAATDIKVAKDLVKKIFTDFRVYAVFIPKVNLTRSLYAQTNHVTSLTDVFAKVQARIDAAKAKGKDVTARQAKLDEAKALAPGITAKINETLAKVETLKPADYPDASKTAIKAYHTAIKDIQAMFRKVNQLLWGTKAVK